VLGQVYLLVVVTLLLVGLAAGLRVLVGIFREGRERQRRRRAGELEPDTEDPEFDASPGGAVEVAPGRVECPDCGATNEAGYDYCEHCTRRL
jgi:hypothetical protein